MAVDLVTTILVGLDQDAIERAPKRKSVSLRKWFSPTIYLKRESHDQRPYTRDKYGNEICLHGIPE